MEKELIWLTTNGHDAHKHMYLHLNTTDHLPNSLDGTRCFNDDELQYELLLICNNPDFHHIKKRSNTNLMKWLRRFYGEHITLNTFLKFAKHLQWRLRKSDDSKTEKLINKT